MCLVFIYRPGHAIAKSHTSYSLLFVLALLCPFWWQGFQLAWSPLRLQGVLGQHARPEQHQIPKAEAFYTIGCLYISLSFRPGYLPNCVLTL